MKILVLNAGSSTQKCKLYEISSAPTIQPPRPLWEANADWSNEQEQTTITIATNHGYKRTDTVSQTARQEVLTHLLASLWSGETRVIQSAADIAVVGHRIVHGGPEYTQSTIITSKVREQLTRLTEFAPLHNPPSLEGIEAAQQLLKDIPHVAVFDTAFHSHLPIEAALYPGPYAWFEQHIRRYGFHGTSHQYCMKRVAQLLHKDPSQLRLVNCHLGSGCSLAAIKNGRSVDTTMGFTPLEGLMMGSRSGSLDPSILTYLQREQGYTAEQLETILNKEAGLKGISGVSSDIRQVSQAADAGNARAQLALDLYIHRLRSFIGAMIASLGGIDVLSFTGGVGEHDTRVRQKTCEAFEFLNLKIDLEKNIASPRDTDIATPDSAVRVVVVHTEEEWEIAQDCWHITQQAT